MEPLSVASGPMPSRPGDHGAAVAVPTLYAYGVERVRRRRGLRKYACGLIPEYLLKQLAFEAHMIGVRAMTWRARRHLRRRTDLLVNVGAGDAGRDGWVNLDGYKARGITYVCDARRSLPLDDGSVRGIFTEHFLEHIDYTEEAPTFLRECFRVLRGGGVLRIVVPDAEKYISAFTSPSWDAFTRMRPLHPGLRDGHGNFCYTTKMELMNVIFRQGYEHKFLYDFVTLKLLLERNGFVDVRRQDLGRSMMPDLCIDLPQRASESLYVEAARP